MVQQAVYAMRGVGDHQKGLFDIGAWLSLVERLVRDQEVLGSNPSAPIFFRLALGFEGSRDFL